MRSPERSHESDDVPPCQRHRCRRYRRWASRGRGQGLQAGAQIGVGKSGSLGHRNGDRRGLTGQQLGGGYPHVPGREALEPGAIAFAPIELANDGGRETEMPCPPLDPCLAAGHVGGHGHPGPGELIRADLFAGQAPRDFESRRGHGIHPARAALVGPGPATRPIGNKTKKRGRVRRGRRCGRARD